MRLTYIRWSMTVIDAMGVVIVTDPVFRVLGLRQVPASYTLDQMPRPHLVFISHTHIDHFEPGVLKRLNPATPVWMPAGSEGKAASLGLRALRGLGPWESSEFMGLRLTTVPAKHNATELGLVIEADRTLYFAGDTSLDCDLFRAIGQRWRLDAVFLPIGDLRTLGLPVGHIQPRQAPEALRLLGMPRVVIPTHYSGLSLPPLMTFRGTPRKLSQAIHQAGLGALVGTTRPLETVEI